MTESVSTPQTGRTWLAQLLTGEPHQVIGHADRPYLLRWYLIKPNRFCNLYFHRFVGSDDPTPHDHPWPFVTLVLAGTYIEVDQQFRERRRRRGSIAFRPATWRHTVQLLSNPTGSEPHELPCSTIVLTGPRLRPWGFWCSGERFVPWQKFGPGGCGELADTTTTRPQHNPSTGGLEP